MKSIQKLLLVVACLCAVPGVPLRADAPGVEVVGLVLQKKIPAQKRLADPFSGPEAAEFSGEGPGVTTSRTQLRLRLSVPGKSIVSVDDKSKFNTFTDDKGTDLFALPGHKADEEERNDWMAFNQAEISEGGGDCTLGVWGSGSPAPGASKILFSGTIVLNCSGPIKTAQQTGVALKNGATISAGPVPLTITNLKPKGAGLSLILLAHKPDNQATINIRFFDAAGKEIPAQNEESGTGGSPGDADYEETEEYVLSRKVPSMTVKITFHTDMKKVTVPVQLESGLGLK